MRDTMGAIVVRPGEPRSARAAEIPTPRPGPGEYLVQILEVGIDGTDREIDAAEYGVAPAGMDTLVLGHEAIGRVVQSCPGVDYLRDGELVVPMVRRPCPQRDVNCRHGEPDFCLTGNYTEAGIKGLGGFLAELVAVPAEYVVQVPEELRSVGVLVEPLSVVEKAFRQAWRIQERMLWQPRRMLIAGAGSIGVLAALIARLRGLEVLVYSRGPAIGVPGEILREIGAHYADAEREELTAAVGGFGAPDFALEATGYSPLAWQAAGVLERNGVACLLSVTGGTGTAEIPSDALNRFLVLGNRVVFGSVSAHRRDFEQAVADLGQLAVRWPTVLERFITRRLPMERIREALDTRDAGGLKTVLEVARGGARARA